MVVWKLGAAITFSRRVPRLRRSGSFMLATQPFRAGLTFGIRASGPWELDDDAILDSFNCNPTIAARIDDEPLESRQDRELIPTTSRD
jgi:hypothetical protein